MPTAFEDKGLGGAIKVMVTCHGCGNKIHYASSMVCLKETRRNCVSLALGLCFLIWGHGYPIYHKVLRLGLGMQTLAYKNFFNIIRIAHPVVKSILDEICEMGKSEMKAKDPTELGSWQRAVTTSDGCWLIRGHHSQCCTFVVINFLTGCTLYYGHACMRGSNNSCDSELWEGTAKAAEGHLAEVCFSKAKEEGMVVAITGKMPTPRQQNHLGMSFLTAPLAVLCFVEAMSVVHMPTILKIINQRSQWTSHLFLCMLKTIHNWHLLSVNVLVRGHIPKNAVVCQMSFLDGPKATIFRP